MQTPVLALPRVTPAKAAILHKMVEMDGGAAERPKDYLASLIAYRLGRDKGEMRRHLKTMQALGLVRRTGLRNIPTFGGRAHYWSITEEGRLARWM